jgi:hypothetical protein
MNAGTEKIADYALAVAIALALATLLFFGLSA